MACYRHAVGLWFTTLVLCYRCVLLVECLCRFHFGGMQEVEAVHSLQAEEQDAAVGSISAMADKSRRSSNLSITYAALGSPKVVARARRSLSINGSVLSSVLARDARSMSLSGIMIRTQEDHLKARVQHLLLSGGAAHPRLETGIESAHSEICASGSAVGRRDTSSGDISDLLGHSRENSEVLLRESGPKAKDAERLMLQRHRKTNTSTNSSWKSFSGRSDGIRRRIASELERNAALAAVEKPAQVLGVMQTS